MTDEHVQSTSIPIRIVDTDQSKIAQYINSISVTGQGDLVLLSFSQYLQPSIETDEDAEYVKQYGVEGHTVARVLVPESIFRSFILDLAAQIGSPAAEEDSDGR